VIKAGKISQQKQVDLQQKPFADQKNKYDKKGINFQAYFKKKESL